MAFPSPATDGQTATVGGLVYTYNSTKGTWTKVGAGGGSGGGASVTVSDTAPTSPSAGNMWWSSALGKMFIYYDDVTSTQWVEDSTNYSGIDATTDTDTGSASSNLYNRLIDGGGAT